ncbi:MAG: hypothetical protein JRN20_04775 [Nitrososphaerota archaeon]|nr:hypothetical protein [Nitrososphaerota archaeon]
MRAPENKAAISTAGFITAPESLPSITIINPTTNPKVRAMRQSDSILVRVGIAAVAIIETGPKKMRVNMPTNSAVRSFR